MTDLIALGIVIFTALALLVWIACDIIGVGQNDEERQ